RAGPARLRVALRWPAPQLALVASPETLGLERIDEREPPPGPAEVDVVAAVLDLRPGVDLARDEGDELLHTRHRVPVVGVGLVPFDHGELGLVLVGRALVAEVL